MSTTRRNATGSELVIDLEHGTLTAPDQETADRAIAEHEAREARERLRRERWGDDGREAMARLCQRFPTLREVEGAGRGPWDADRVLAWACGPISKGERLAALFVLCTWNGTTNWDEIAHLPGDAGEPPLLGPNESLPPFDLHEAWATWDHEQRQAALAWMEAPFWP